MFNIGEINELLKQGFSVTAVAKELKVPKTTLLRNLKKECYVLSEKDGFKYYEKQNEISPKNSSDVATNLEDAIVSIKDKLNSIVHNFITISIELNVIYTKKLYEEKGYKNISEFSSAELGLDKDKTYRFLKIYNTCFDKKTKLIKDEYKQFNYSQLVEIVYLPNESKKKVTSDMSVKQIRELKKQNKDDKQEKEVSEIEGQQTFIEADYKQVDEVSLEQEHLQDRDYKKEFEALKEAFEKRNNRFKDKEKELIELRAKLDKEVKIKVDLSLAISLLEIAWSNETDDNKASELRKQIDYIRSLN